MKKAGLLIGLVLLVGIIAVGLSQAGGGGRPVKEKKAAKVEDEKLKEIRAEAGRLMPGGEKELEAKIQSLKGYPVVVNVWASWCGPCKMEAPFLTEAAKRYGGKVAFLGVNLQDGSEPAKKFIDRYKLPFPSIEDPEGQVYDRYKLRGAPATIFINKEGRREVHTGAYASYESLSQGIQNKALK